MELMTVVLILAILAVLGDVMRISEFETQPLACGPCGTGVAGVFPASADAGDDDGQEGEGLGQHGG